MEVLVFGAGSLGSLLGGLLATSHDVTLVGRRPHVDAIRAGGLRITGRLDRSVEVEAATEVGDRRADLALVAVKAYDTPAAAAALADGDLGAVLSVQNGMGNEATLAARIEAPVLAGTTTYAARWRDAGRVECTGLGTVTLGPRPGAAGDDLDRAETVAAAFGDAGLDARCEPDMRPILWEKLAVNAGINPVTALAGVENGALLDGPAASVAEAAAAEVARVATAAGVDLDEAAALAALRRVVEATAGNRSSMLADVSAGRRTEIDAITGFVVETAEEPVPVNETLAALVRALEAASDSG